MPYLPIPTSFVIETRQRHVDQVEFGHDVDVVDSLPGCDGKVLVQDIGGEKAPLPYYFGGLMLSSNDDPRSALFAARVALMEAEIRYWRLRHGE